MAAPDEQTGTDWLDRDIAALRQAVEREAPRGEAPIEIHAGSPRRRLRLVRPADVAERDSTATRLLAAPIPYLRQARRFVRRHYGDLVLFAFCVGVTMAAVWVVLWIGNG
jgi:hypothetical protein